MLKLERKHVEFAIGVVLGAICFATRRPSNRVAVAYSGCCCQGDAVKAISDSTMCSSDKAEAISSVDCMRGSSYYESIMAIAESTMCSSDKAEAIANLR